MRQKWTVVMLLIGLLFAGASMAQKTPQLETTSMMTSNSTKSSLPQSNQDMVYFQAHRGGLKERPENTMETYLYAWNLGGLPEADIQTTKDDVIISLHDKTLARTTNAPAPIKDQDVSTLTYEEIRKWDAGIYYGEEYAGEKVPALTEVFEVLQKHPEWQVYLDLKRVDLEKLGTLIEKYGVGKQIIFAHNKQENLIRFSQIAPDVRTMLWIGGKPEEIKAKFEKARQTGFKGLNQVQLHLHNQETEQGIKYYFEDQYLKEVLSFTREAGLDLEVLPFEFDNASLSHLLDLGIRWYATDYPQRFADTVQQWRMRK